MKRIFDIVISIVLLIVTAPLFLVIAIGIRREDYGSIFYVAERMKTPNKGFHLIKFRTMSDVPDYQNTGVTGGDKMDRITALGRKLRRYRLDELPQLINVLRGDMSFVGPRPPLRQYTDTFPELYGKVLRSRPGITGLATLHIHQYEERIMSPTTLAQDTETIYTTRCIPRKATLDLIYQRHASVWFDMVILWQTLCKVVTR